MCNLQRYFILIIFFAVAFLCVAENTDCTISECQTLTLPSDGETQYVDNSSFCSEYYLPSLTIGVNAFRPHPTAKRTGSEHKNNYEFVKAGKVINVGICNFVQRKPLNFLSIFIKSAYRLSCLGKLII